MTKRVCRTHGCPRIQDGKLCSEHAKQHEKARGSRQQRGYGAAHDKERRRIELSGIENHRCARCHVQFERGEPFQLGHTDDRLDWSGPEHIRCNTGAAGVASHALFERADDGRRGVGAPPTPTRTAGPPGRGLDGPSGSYDFWASWSGSNSAPVRFNR